MFSLTCSTDATPIVALHLRPGVFEEFSLSFDLAPSISTSKVCGVSFPYLICIAGLALSDLIGLTRLSWVSLLVSPNQCGEWALAPALYLYYITDRVVCQGVFDNFFYSFWWLWHRPQISHNSVCRHLHPLDIISIPQTAPKVNW